VGKLKLEWESLSTERAGAFNEWRARLHPYAPLPPERMLDSRRIRRSQPHTACCGVEWRLVMPLVQYRDCGSEGFVRVN
jgi:hypothetical protein